MPTRPTVGVQIGSHSLLDHGVEPTLDRLHEHGIDTLLLFTHNYANRPHQAIWVQAREAHYAHTSLRHPAPVTADPHAGVDILEEVIEPARQRGMRVIPRMLEWGHPRLLQCVPGMSRVLAEDVHGQPDIHPCLANPDYAEFLRATAEDLASNYPIDGWQFGCERDGALSETLLWGRQATCFCQHCCATARARGIDPERARAGYLALEHSVRSHVAAPGAAESGFVSILRLLLRYPEIAAWHQLWYDNLERLARQLFGTVKSCRPQAETWWHIWHYQVAFDLFGRAAIDYGRLADACDVLKPVVYHECGADRFAGFLTDHYRRCWLAELAPEQTRELLFALMGYDPASEPSSLAAMHSGSLSATYVERETARCVRESAGRCRVIPGIGLDMPIAGEIRPVDPELVQACVEAALRAGAAGVLLSREFDEMRPESLAAVRAALARPCPPTEPVPAE